MNDGNEVWTQDFCSDTTSNHHLSQKPKLTRMDEFYHLIYKTIGTTGGDREWYFF
jgi:hypothetical protein